MAAVHLDEQAGAPHALAALPVFGWPASLRTAQTRRPEEAMHGRVGEDDVFPLSEELGEMLVVDVGVDGPGEPDHTSPDGRTDSTG